MRLAGHGASWIIPFYKSPSACTRQVAGKSKVAAEKRLAELKAERERLMKASEALKTQAGEKADSARADLKQSLDALVQGDAALARKVCGADREVNKLNRAMHRRIQQEIREHPDQVERLIHTLSVSRHLERIGDLATNVAEDVIYTVEGEIVRHRKVSYP